MRRGPGDLRAQFSKFDTNGDGSLSYDEILQMLTRTTNGGRPLSHKDAIEFLQNFDKDGDGKLSLDEFVQQVGPVWAKGVGTSFEFLNERNEWQPITEKNTIDQLGRLSAANEINEVYYTSSFNSQSYKATMAPDGWIDQKNTSTGVSRAVRLVPFFFEFEEAPYKWLPITDPEVLMSLTAVLASSQVKEYKYRGNDNYLNTATAKLASEKGLISQTNVQTNRVRDVRASPIGPDGEAHFEFLENGGKWTPVSSVCVKQLASVAVGRGDAYYNLTVNGGAHFRYQATLGDDGFIIQKNLSTNKGREVRPAPWLGHGTATANRVRVDPTDGYYRGRDQAEQQAAARGGRQEARSMDIPMAAAPAGGSMMTTTSSTTTTTTTTTTQVVQMAAADFLVPEAVALGSAEAPLALVEQPATAEPMAQAYYYKPEVMEEVPMAMPC